MLSTTAGEAKEDAAKESAFCSLNVDVGKDGGELKSDVEFPSLPTG